ncbi:Hypothetical protein FKW44_011871 [Caligus rogercresseyi]|uniref:Uncharacterized protein n=1 Tax=Caligus rogercresseyi TaxID=217165 RepID=A0A7T8HIY5_CALRO|nr:Hypothetical protein FKW44_011871 [Caligus rogercresseyi]
MVSFLKNALLSPYQRILLSGAEASNPRAQSGFRAKSMALSAMPYEPSRSDRKSERDTLIKFALANVDWGGDVMSLTSRWKTL